MSTLYPGDRVRIAITDWHSSFRGMRGVVVCVEDRLARVRVHLDGDARDTLFFPHEVVADLEAP